MTEPNGLSSFLERRELLKERRGMVVIFGVSVAVLLIAVFLQIAVANLNGKIEKSNADLKSVEDNIAELKTQSGVLSYEILSRAKNEIIGQIEKSRVQNSVRELRKIASSADFSVVFQGFAYSKWTITTSAQFVSTPDTGAVEYARRFLEYFRDGKSRVFKLGKVSNIEGDDRTRTFAVELKIIDTKPSTALSNIDLSASASGSVNMTATGVTSSGLTAPVTSIQK